MSELKRTLEAAAARARIEDDPFEALERRRRRKDRGRRIRAGLVAFSVAVAAIGGVVLAFQDAGRTPRPGSAPPDTFLGAVWPELVFADAAATQAALDAGDQSLAWRLDPLQVAEAFLTEVLRWEPALLDMRWVYSSEAIPSADPGQLPGDVDTLIVDVTSPAAPCPSPAPGEPLDPSCLPRQATLTMSQPVRSGLGGIWNVAAVTSNMVHFGAPTFAAGDEVTVSIDPVDGAVVWVGAADAGGVCLVAPHMRSSAALDIPGADSGCTDGTYLYAVVRDPSERGPEAPTPFDGIETIAIAIVPVMVPAKEAEPPVSVSPSPVQSPSPQEEPGGANVPDALRVTCTSNGMELASTEVQPQPDGVHIQIENPEGLIGHWHATLLGRNDGRFDTFGTDMGGSNVFTFPPGPIFVNCFIGPSFDAAKVTRDQLVKIEVVDPHGLWVSDRLACDQPVEATGFQPFAGLTDEENDHERVIRDHVPGVLANDEVLPAEYGIREDYAWMIVRRDGENLARFQVTGHKGQWGVHFGETCPGSGIAEG
jgi:hypothetical protein